ncbi:MAG: hypothetical protein KatS3mg032_1189 [Cyclobacteriaceae bacterium]|nr:MAG: hypothetical protein KatS3mg032_1189 [Cyclobacteriaceae bacterium]
MIAVKNELTAQIDEQLKALERIFKEEIPAFNALVKAKNIDAVILKD